ncbi:single-stranded DNA-binding protein [Actinobacillus genomosp. 2]|uniref:single-stranded DNA-binding protein n=1 Tax=Actinobacillus genomosp. 2 TaxID=230709 RepID=UPI0024422760|nr:single-stranded DNA-binding protein [Actinobacillus genomosp. 2]WGE32539.1 single-stranded DNA-binding protein [Actinobacillus genomosp. 2]
MAGMNKAMIVGYVGQEPRLTTLNNGEGACRMSIATSESWTDKRTGEKVEKTEWHSVVLFGRLAEIVGQYVRTGDLIGIEGKLQIN